MARGISIDGVSLPVTDANISYTKEPIAEISILDNGNEIIYEGLYKNIQGTFSGAVREGLIGDLLDSILESTAHTITVSDDTAFGLVASNAYISMLEITAKSGEIAKFNAQFTAQSISDGSAVEPAEFASDVVPFYDVNPGFGAKAISIKIDRPYSADDFVLVEQNHYVSTNRVSKYISDMKQMKISGTITLSQHALLTSFSTTAALTLQFGDVVISISNPNFIVGKEISISGRSPVTKTISWTCSSSALRVS